MAKNRNRTVSCEITTTPNVLLFIWNIIFIVFDNSLPFLYGGYACVW
jgi:hypothetical protein